MLVFDNHEHFCCVTALVRVCMEVVVQRFGARKARSQAAISRTAGSYVMLFQALIPSVSLTNGVEMQRLALGLYNVPRDQVKASKGFVR